MVTTESRVDLSRDGLDKRKILPGDLDLPLTQGDLGQTSGSLLSFCLQEVLESPHHLQPRRECEPIPGKCVAKGCVAVTGHWFQLK